MSELVREDDRGAPLRRDREAEEIRLATLELIIEVEDDGQKAASGAVRVREIDVRREALTAQYL